MPERKDHPRPATPSGDDAEMMRAVSSKDVAEARPAFLTAIANARTELALTERRHYSGDNEEDLSPLDMRCEARRQRLTLVRRVAYAAAAAVLVLLSCGGLAALLLLFSPKPIEATPELGLHAQVISVFDLRPVSGVEVYRILRRDWFMLSAELVAKTDALGGFEIPAANEVESTEYELRFAGRKVGDEFHTGKGEQYARGDEKFRVDIQPERDKHERNVSLKPGQTKTLPSGLRITLDNRAKTGWCGKVIDDKQWPSNFLFAQVAGGIYMIEGPPSPDLRLSAFVSGDTLKLFETPAEHLRLIAQSEKYYELEKHKKQLEWRSANHQGWYVTNMAPYKDLPQQTPDIQPVPNSANEPSGAWVGWDAHPGTQYAILAPPPAQGQAVVCWIEDGSGSSAIPAIRLLGRNRVQPLVYDVVYYYPKNDEYYYYPEYMYRPANECSFSEGLGSREYFHQDAFVVPLFEMFSHHEVPGQFWLRLMDFTLSGPHVFGPVTYNIPEPPGQYSIEFDKHGIGEVSRMKLTGDTKRLAQPPAWDFYCDGVEDAYGESADICIHHEGAFRMRAILHERSGNVIFVEGCMDFKPPQVLGYEHSSPSDLPVMEGVASNPSAVASARIVSNNAVSSPAAYGCLACNVAGPELYIDPPAGFHNTPLKELRITLFAKATGGDAEKMYLSPMIGLNRPATNKTHPSLGDFSFDWFKLNGDRIPIDADTGYRVQCALDRADDPLYMESPAQFLSLEFSTGHGDKGFKRLTGIDIHNLPTEKALVAQLREYQRNRYFGMEYAKATTTRLYWVQHMWGFQIPEGSGMLVYVQANDYNLLYAGQWDIYSGGDYPSCVELVRADGQPYKVFYNFSGLGGESTSVKP
jgi:hypothetical protein